MWACHWPGNQNSHVVMSWVRVTLGVEVLLPSAETGQSRVCVVNDLQPLLQHRAELGFQYHAAFCQRNFVSRLLRSFINHFANTIFPFQVHLR